MEQDIKQKTMEKQIIVKDIGKEKEIATDYSYGDNPVSIDEIIEFLSSSRKDGATHVKLTGSSYDGQIEEIDIQPVHVKEESDTECESRLKKESDSKAYKEKLARIEERKQYEALKLKYGN